MTDSACPVPTYGLFAHQRQVRRDLMPFVQSSGSRVLVHMPTGSGKTRTMANAIADHLRTVEGGAAIWLAHSEELCDQAFDELTTAWTHLGDREIQFFRWWGEHELPSGDVSDCVIVAGLAKAYARIKKDAGFLPHLASRASLVVMDEAHQAVAPSYRLILDTLATGDISVVGLSATPGRTWNDIDQDAELAAFFKRNKIGIDSRPMNPVDYLVEEGFLARPSFENLNHDPGLTLTNRDLEELGSGLDVPRRVLYQLGTDQLRLMRVAQRVQALTRDHSHVLVFAPSVHNAIDTAVVLSALGVEAHAVTADSSSEHRRNAIRRYRSSDGPIALVNYGVLTTGFDAPSTSAAVIARPTTSLVLYFQMVGRALRGRRAGGNPAAQIVTVVDTGLPGFGDVGEAFLNWEDVW